MRQHFCGGIGEYNLSCVSCCPCGILDSITNSLSSLQLPISIRQDGNQYHRRPFRELHFCYAAVSSRSNYVRLHTESSSQCHSPCGLRSRSHSSTLPRNQDAAASLRYRRHSRLRDRSNRLRRPHYHERQPLERHWLQDPGTSPNLHEHHDLNTPTCNSPASFDLSLVSKANSPPTGRLHNPRPLLPRGRNLPNPQTHNPHPRPVQIAPSATPLHLDLHLGRRPLHSPASRRRRNRLRLRRRSRYARYRKQSDDCRCSGPGRYYGDLFCACDRFWDRIAEE